MQTLDFAHWYRGVPAPFYGYGAPAGLPRIVRDSDLPPSAGIFLGFDSVGKGEWRGRYGSAGFALAGAEPVLPAWVGRFDPIGAPASMPGDPTDAPREDGTAGSAAWTTAWSSSSPELLVVATDQAWRRISLYLWDGRETPGPLTVELRDGSGSLVASHAAPAGRPRWVLAAFRGAVRVRVVEGGSLVGAWFDPYLAAYPAGSGSLVGPHPG